MRASRTGSSFVGCSWLVRVRLWIRGAILSKSHDPGRPLLSTLSYLSLGVTLAGYKLARSRCVCWCCTVPGHNSDHYTSSDTTKTVSTMASESATKHQTSQIVSEVPALNDKRTAAEENTARQETGLSKKARLSAYFTIAAAAFGLISDGCECSSTYPTFPRTVPVL